MRDVNFLNIRLARVIGGTAGDVAVAITHLGADGQEFNPCKLPGDLPNAVCSMPGAAGYFVNEFTFPDGTNTFPYGIFLPNLTRGLYHGWGNRAVRAHVELWPKKRRRDRPDEWEENLDFAALRFEVSAFEHPANGGLYSPDIGTIEWPAHGPRTTYINGYVKKRGPNGPEPLRPGERELVITLFGHPDPRNVSSTGYPVLGMSETGVSADDGYWSSRPLLTGSYDLIVDDRTNKRGYKTAVNLSQSLRYDIAVDDLPPWP